jgi:hypothetical protein
VKDLIYVEISVKEGRQILYVTYKPEYKETPNKRRPLIFPLMESEEFFFTELEMSFISECSNKNK